MRRISPPSGALFTFDSLFVRLSKTTLKIGKIKPPCCPLPEDIRLRDFAESGGGFRENLSSFNDPGRNGREILTASAGQAKVF